MVEKRALAGALLATLLVAGCASSPPSPAASPVPAVPHAEVAGSSASLESVYETGLGGVGVTYAKTSCADVLFHVTGDPATLSVDLRSAPVNASAQGGGLLGFSLRAPDESARSALPDSTGRAALSVDAPAPGDWVVHVVPIGAAYHAPFKATVRAKGAAGPLVLRCA